MKAMIAFTNAQILSVAPALYSDSVASFTDPNGPVNYVVKQSGGSTYLFSCAMRDSNSMSYTFHLAGMPASVTAEVLGENRSVTLTGGSFQDDFSHLGVHLYKDRRARAREPGDPRCGSHSGLPPSAVECGESRGAPVRTRKEDRIVGWPATRGGASPSSKPAVSRIAFAPPAVSTTALPGSARRSPARSGASPARRGIGAECVALILAAAFDLRLRQAGVAQAVIQGDDGPVVELDRAGVAGVAAVLAAERHRAAGHDDAAVGVPGLPRRRG